LAKTVTDGASLDGFLDSAETVVDQRQLLDSDWAKQDCPTNMIVLRGLKQLQLD
jgi:hypothetical protein